MNGRVPAVGGAVLMGAAAAGWAAHRLWRILLAGAEPRGRAVSVDEELALVSDMLDALRDLADTDGGSPSDDRVYGFSIRWGAILAGRWVRLSRYRGQGRLAPPQRAIYDQLRDELRQATTLIDRLGLRSPTM